MNAESLFKAARPIVGRLLIAISALTLTLKPSCSATIELAGRGEVASGIKIEGEIEGGDALKLLRLYEYFGPHITSTVYLRSRGGNVEEAMKIGYLIRRFRLETSVPWMIGGTLVDLGNEAAPVDPENLVCASACILIYAAGASRSGNLLILHRPSPKREFAKNLTDNEFEEIEKHAIDTVRSYLSEMELDQFYIDKVIATNSQDGYAVTIKDVQAHPLVEIPPSIEEVILSKCEDFTSIERKTLYDMVYSRSKINRKLYDTLDAKQSRSIDCKVEQLDELRMAAWNREIERMVNYKCRPFVYSLAEPQTEMPPGPPGWTKTLPRKVCLKYSKEYLTDEVETRGFNAKPGDTPPATLTVDDSILEIQR